MKCYSENKKTLEDGEEQTGKGLWGQRKNSIEFLLCSAPYIPDEMLEKPSPGMPANVDKTHTRAGFLWAEDKKQGSLTGRPFLDSDGLTAVNPTENSVVQPHLTW